ncbi:MAG TPA: polyphenol oxidase family protein [Acidimicrobiia bacterium]
MGFVEVGLGAARVVFTDRHGGISAPPYDTANLGVLTDDDPAAVAENRRRVAAAVGGAAADAATWFRMRQVHGAVVVVAERAGAGVPDADAVVTARPGTPLVVLTADCAPVALVSAGALGAVHAGWRGLAAGVVEAAAAALRRLDEAPVRAVIGPCIHPARYPFGATELALVADRLGPTVVGRTEAGEPALDLRAGVRAALAAAGVTAVDDVDLCTAASLDHFSYRRDGVTGRQAMLVVRES